MIDYLKTFERAANLFPGFESEIQGLYREIDASGAIRFFTYVVRESERGHPRRTRADDDAGRRQGRRRRDGRAASRRAPVARGRRAGDAGDLSPSHPPRRRSQLRRRHRSARRRRPQTAAQEHAARPAAASRRRAERRRASATPTPCRSASGPPTATRSSIRSTSAPRASGPRHRPLAARRLDRRLRGGRLPADDRLYRRRQRGLAQAARDPSAFSRSAISRRSATSSAAGPTR